MSVLQRGTDSSGRPVRATAYCWAAWDAACAVLGFEPTIVQGGHMGSAGADASAGTHAGDAFDVRLWDRTADERARMIEVFRAHGFAYWERYESQGFDLHAHMVPGPWASPAPQALDQWHDYLAGRNGLASNGPDYHPRPDPIVTTPPEDDMADYAAQLDAIQKTVEQIQQGQKAMRENVRKRDVALRGLVVDALEAVRQDKRADRVVIGKLTAIEAALAEDVDSA